MAWIGRLLSFRFGRRTGALYIGGGLFFDDYKEKDWNQNKASSSDVLIYSPGCGEARQHAQSVGDVLIASAHLHGLRAHMGVRRTCR